MNPNSLYSFADDLLGCGINPAPVNEKKFPFYEWKHLQTEFIGDERLAELAKKAWGISMICGKISGGLETIDFDSHYEDIKPVFDTFMGDAGVADIINRNRLYVERTIGKGFHIIYKYEAEEYEGNVVLAANEDNKTLIETRGEGGLIVCAPSPGYTVLSGDLIKMAPISKEERDYLLKTARLYNRSVNIKEPSKGEQKGFENTDPISWFNWSKAAYAKKLLEDIGWHWVSTKDNIEQWERPGKSEGTTSGTWGRKENQFYVFSSNAEPFKDQCYYTPFQILVKLIFKGNYNAAINWLVSKYFDEEIPYIRVGVDYFKKIKKSDRYAIDGQELKRWNKDEIKLDYSAQYLQRIPKFDDFCIVPDNFSFHPVVNNCYNLYSEFRHKPKQGSIKWSKILIEHVFGEQSHLGIRYLQVMYLHPDRMLPILVLVSKERQTGKTTFLNWLNMIFGQNMVVISPDDLANGFNHLYATANIIAVEETLIEKNITVERIKALSTGKFISVNQKFVSQYKLPFFGKIIMTSNNEDKFARIDEDEIRFLVRKLSTPKFTNHNIEEDLRNEIPAFLHYLTTLPAVDFTVGRVPFTSEELNNNELRSVKKESRSSLYKDLFELFTEYFENDAFLEPTYATPIDIKKKWFDRDSKIDIQYIRHVLKNEYNLKPKGQMKYTPFRDGYDTKKNGRPFEFTPEMFGITETLKDDPDDSGTPF